MYVCVNRSEAIRRGVNGTDTPVQVELDVSAMAQEDREQVAARLNLQPQTSGGYGTPMLPAPRLVQFYDNTEKPCPHSIMWVNEPSQAGVLEALAVWRANWADACRKAVEVHAASEAHAKLVAEWIASASDEDLQARRLLLERNQYEDSPIQHDANVSLRDAYAAIPQPVIDSAKQRLAAYSARVKAADEAAKQAKRDAEAQARLDWIARHGSRRLVTMAAEGIECTETYERELARYEGDQFQIRLAAARPGWQVVEESQVDRRVANVPQKALDILAAGRQISKTCKLAKHGGKYVCVDTFESRLIVWPPRD